MSYYIGIDNKHREIDWDLIFLNRNKNINGKYIISIVEYQYCIDNYLEFYFLLDQCIDLIHNFGIYKTITMVAKYHNEIITLNELKNNKKMYIRLAKLLLQHLSSFDIIANVENGGYIPFDTLDDDTISKASTEVEYFESDIESDIESDTDTESCTDTDTETEDETYTETESDTESDNETETETECDNETESEEETESESCEETDSEDDTDTDNGSEEETDKK